MYSTPDVIFSILKKNIRKNSSKGMKTVGVTDYTQNTLCNHLKGGVDVRMS